MLRDFGHGVADRHLQGIADGAVCDSTASAVSRPWIMSCCTERWRKSVTSEWASLARSALEVGGIVCTRAAMSVSGPCCATMTGPR
jgi:hypothetical protein